MKIKVKTLTGGALAWAAAIAMGWTDVMITDYEEPGMMEEPFFGSDKCVDGVTISRSGVTWAPQANDAQAGFIIDRLGIRTEPMTFSATGFSEWHADLPKPHSSSPYGYLPMTGSTRKEAAMRACVAFKMGPEVEVPEVLLTPFGEESPASETTAALIPEVCLARDAVTGAPVFGFEHDGTFITNPMVSECSRFVVDPTETYGIASNIAQALRSANRLLCKRGREAIDDAADILREQGLKVDTSTFPAEGGDLAAK